MLFKIEKLSLTFRTFGTNLNLHKLKPKISAFVPCRSFYEQYPEGHERYARPRPRFSLKDIKDSINAWQEEWKEHLALDPKIYTHGDTEIIWQFDSQEKLGKWIVTADKDNNDGFSECQLVPSKSGKGLFNGTLCTRLPKDGIIKKSGYCNITAMKITKSNYFCHPFFDWTQFTHLVLRIRGDGRTYMVNLRTSGYYDVSWLDLYTFVLHTRGGPYWQTAMLPFSRFMLTSKGLIQDKQGRVPLQQISSLGITCADKINGNFQLELDYIGVHYDENFTEDFAYESYTYGKNLLW